MTFENEDNYESSPAIAFIELTLTGATPFALAAARALGRRTVLFTTSTAKYVAAAIDMSVVDEVVQMSTDRLQAEEIAALCRVRGVDGVIALDDHNQSLAAIVREILGLHGASSQAIARCQDKRQTRINVAGIGRDVRFATVNSRTKQSPVGYPVIVKPSTGSSSIGVYLCHDESAFQAALIEAARAIENKDGASLMVEEAVDGPEFSAELAWEDSSRGWKLIGLTRTHISPPPHRRELGVVFPGMPGNSVPSEIESVIQRWLGAVGLDEAVAHVELRLTSDGPALIEINPRVAGGDIPRIVHHSTGIDLVGHYVALHCGQSADIDLRPVRGAGSIWFISPTREGRLLSMKQPDRPWPSGVDAVYRPLPPLMPVTRQSRLAYVVATAPTPAEALELATSHAAEHRMEIESS